MIVCELWNGNVTVVFYGSCKGIGTGENEQLRGMRTRGNRHVAADAIPLTDAQARVPASYGTLGYMSEAMKGLRLPWMRARWAQFP